MNENQPIEETSEILEKGRKLREMVATDGWQEYILPFLKKTKQGYADLLLTTEWETLDEHRKFRAKYKAIEELLGLIENEISTAEEIELQAAIEPGEKYA